MLGWLGAFSKHAEYGPQPRNRPGGWAFVGRQARLRCVVTCLSYSGLMATPGGPATPTLQQGSEGRSESPNSIRLGL